jgi:hypothetical protein
VRPKQPLHFDWKFHPGARIRGEQFLADSDQHTAKHPQLLMDCRWLEAVFLNHPGSGLDLNTRLQPPSKVELDVVRSNLTDRSVAECLLEKSTGALVASAALHKEIHYLARRKENRSAIGVGLFASPII